jgi:hypothetical protein
MALTGAAIAVTGIIAMTGAQVVYPNAALTPGKTAQVTDAQVCRTGYTHDARHVTQAISEAIAQARKPAEAPKGFEVVMPQGPMPWRWDLAGRAMQALIAEPGSSATPLQTADNAVAYADALIAVLTGRDPKVRL